MVVGPTLDRPGHCRKPPGAAAAARGAHAATHLVERRLAALAGAPSLA